MSTTEVAWLVLALAAGALIGAAYFYGLWWTIGRMSSSRRPALLLLGSSLVRTAVAVAAFWLISGGQWQRLVACVLGFVLARLVMMRVYRPEAVAPVTGTEVAPRGTDA